MVLRIVIGVIFILFAMVQLNDPDPWIWVFTYGCVGAAFILSIKVKMIPWVLYLMMSLLLLGIAGYVPNVITWMEQGMPSIIDKMKASSPHIEWMREFLGLILCMLGLIWLYNLDKKNQPK